MLYIFFLLVVKLNMPFKDKNQFFKFLAIANDLFPYIYLSKVSVGNQLVLESIRADIKKISKFLYKVFENHGDKLGLHSRC